MDCLFERLAQEILPAFWIGQVAVNRQHDVIGDERLGGGKEAEVALDHATLILGQPFPGLPKSDVGLHRHLGRHPVIVAARQVFRPGPPVFERHELVQIGARIDHPLVVDAHPHRGAVDFPETRSIRLRTIRRCEGRMDDPRR